MRLCLLPESRRWVAAKDAANDAVNMLMWLRDHLCGLWYLLGALKVPCGDLNVYGSTVMGCKWWLDAYGARWLRPCCYEPSQRLVHMYASANMLDTTKHPRV